MEVLNVTRNENYSMHLLNERDYLRSYASDLCMGGAEFEYG
jgi:hypothetical protein